MQWGHERENLSATFCGLLLKLLASLFVMQNRRPGKARFSKENSYFEKIPVASKSFWHFSKNKKLI